MSDTKFQASTPPGSEVVLNGSDEETFLNNFYLFLRFKPRTPAAGPFCILGPLFEQTW